MILIKLFEKFGLFSDEMDCGEGCSRSGSKRPGQDFDDSGIADHMATIS